jgi:hypothetical protein
MHAQDSKNSNPMLISLHIQYLTGCIDLPGLNRIVVIRGSVTSDLAQLVNAGLHIARLVNSA